MKNKYKSISDINLDIDNILKNYYNKELGVTFNIYDLERLIEELSYVKYARVALTINKREVNTDYQLGHIIEVDGNLYKASKMMGYTGVTEPADGWGIPLNAPPEIDTDIIIQDGSVYWKCFKRLPNMPALSISLRSPSTQYGIGDYMYLKQYPDYMFKCVDIVRISGGTEPDTTGYELGDFIVDGGIVWVVKDYINDDNTGTWSSLTRYQLGQTVNAKGDYSLECVSYTGSTDAKENLSFEQYLYDIVDQDSENAKFFVEGDVTYYFRNGDPIEATYAGGITTFAVNGVVFPVVHNIGGESVECTEIRVTRYQDGAETESIIDPTKHYTTLEAPQRGTKDGTIQWTLIKDTDSITYDWNSYVTFTHSLEILED